MVWAATVDTGMIAPSAGSSGDIVVVSTATTLTAGSPYFSEWMLTGQVTVTQMRCWFSGTPTGNCDMGIYDSTGTNGDPGNLLGHTGAIAAVTGMFTQNLTANLILGPGKYWLAWLDTVADSIIARASQGAGFGILRRVNASNWTQLLTTPSSLVDTGNRVGVMALFSGGFS